MSDLGLMVDARHMLRTWLRQMHGAEEQDATRVGAKLDDVILRLDEALRPKQIADVDNATLAGSMDADVWAHAFVKAVTERKIARDGSTPPERDVDTMRTWFAGAIMAGYDMAQRHAQRERAETPLNGGDHWIYDRAAQSTIEALPRGLGDPSVPGSPLEKVLGIVRYALRAASCFGMYDKLDPDAVCQNARVGWQGRQSREIRGEHPETGQPLDGGFLIHETEAAALQRQLVDEAENREASEVSVELDTPQLFSMKVAAQGEAPVDLERAIIAPGDHPEEFRAVVPTTGTRKGQPLGAPGIPWWELSEWRMLAQQWATAREIHGPEGFVGSIVTKLLDAVQAYQAREREARAFADRVTHKGQRPPPIFVAAAKAADHPRPWRTGHKIEKNLYDANGTDLGRMDTPALARTVVASVNMIGALAEEGVIT
jgi:hypothetical protein